MMEVLRHSIISNLSGGGGGGGSGSMGRLPHATSADPNSLQTPLSPSAGEPSNENNTTLRSPADVSSLLSGGGGGAGGFYSEPEDVKSDDASSVASGLTSADSVSVPGVGDPNHSILDNRR